MFIDTKAVNPSCVLISIYFPANWNMPTSLSNAHEDSFIWFFLAHFDKYVSACSSFPLAISHLADSGIHLEGKSQSDGHLLSNTQWGMLALWHWVKNPRSSAQWVLSKLIVHSLATLLGFLHGNLQVIALKWQTRLSFWKFPELHNDLQGLQKSWMWGVVVWRKWLN